MPRPRKDIDRILKDWPYEPGQMSVRTVKGGDGRDVLQLRVDLGVLQIETHGRPDGERPHGFDTYYDYLLSEVMHEDGDFRLSEDQCVEADREFVQYYHRRICWLTLREFDRAVEDADHTLGLMDFCRAYSPDESWTMSHEQYRPFVLFHRTQAAALGELEKAAGEGEEDFDAAGADAAIMKINEGLERFRELFEEYEIEEELEDDELAGRLIELRESLREQFNVGRTLREKLEDAVAQEKYELAATLRDELAKREKGRR